jgi:GT2 family glycosyltransferase
MKFEIGIPTLNRIDLLAPALILYGRDFDSIKITLVDNGNQPHGRLPANVDIIKNESNIGVGASWNVLCRKIFSDKKNDFAVILNDDIYLGLDKEFIGGFLSNKFNKDSLLRATVDWCAFAISRHVWETVGEFDECFFPAYYEDNSYEYRMKLKGVKLIKTPSLNPVVYNSSKTIEKAPELFEVCKKNKKIYIEMWGGEPQKEKFKTPYNRK